MEKELIHICDVSKSFEKKQVLSHVNLTIKQGQSIALIGHNGTGKSTILRMIAHLTKVTSGNITYAPNLKINYIPDRFPKMDITAQQYIMHMGLIEGLDKNQMKQKSQELFEAFFMESMKDIPMKHLSKGTLQKVAVIQALLTKPSVLLLDEPLSGQDMESQNVFIALMEQLKQQGVAIVMSCHEKHLINQISDYVYEIKQGLLQQVQLEDASLIECDVLVFDIEKEQVTIPIEIEALVKKIENSNSQIKIFVPTPKSNEVILQLLGAGWKLKEMYHEYH
jgi:ABC-type multidrug transport system ATPase subunit